MATVSPLRNITVVDVSVDVLLLLLLSCSLCFFYFSLLCCTFSINYNSLPSDLILILYVSLSVSLYRNLLMARFQSLSISRNPFVFFVVVVVRYSLHHSSIQFTKKWLNGIGENDDEEE